MLKKIQKALQENKEIKSWNLSHITLHDSQQYDLEETTEAIRQVTSKHYKVDVLCDSMNGDNNPSTGLGSVTLLPEEDIKSGIDQAVLTAKLVHNQPYDFPEPGEMPEVELADQELIKDHLGSLNKVLSGIKKSTKNPMALSQNGGRY